MPHDENDRKRGSSFLSFVFVKMIYGTLFYAFVPRFDPTVDLFDILHKSVDVVVRAYRFKVSKIATPIVLNKTTKKKIRKMDLPLHCVVSECVTSIFSVIVYKSCV